MDDKSSNKRLETTLAMLAAIEDHFDVSFLARGGSYGSAKLVVYDNKTGTEMERG